jgi:hypothetical protein
MYKMSIIMSFAVAAILTVSVLTAVMAGQAYALQFSRGELNLGYNHHNGNGADANGGDGGNANGGNAVIVH